MRVLKILSGIAVLLNALHFAHVIHHFYSLDPVHGPGFWAGIALAAVIDIFSWIGGYFLLRSGR
jgi:hypothetical protein